MSLPRPAYIDEHSPQGRGSTSSRRPFKHWGSSHRKNFVPLKMMGVLQHPLPNCIQVKPTSLGCILPYSGPHLKKTLPAFHKTQRQESHPILPPPIRLLPAPALARRRPGGEAAGVGLPLDPRGGLGSPSRTLPLLPQT